MKRFLNQSMFTGYKSQYCIAFFYVKGTCSKYEMIHTGEKPYKCYHCEKDFSSDKSLCCALKGLHKKPAQNSNNLIVSVMKRFSLNKGK